MEIIGDLGTFAPVPRSRVAARPPRFASLVPIAAAAPQQQPPSSSSPAPVVV